MLNHHQRSFSFKKMGTNRGALQLDSVERMRDVGTLNPKWDVFIKPLSSWSYKEEETGPEKIVSLRYDRTDVHKNSQRQ